MVQVNLSMSKTFDIKKIESINQCIQQIFKFGVVIHTHISKLFYVNGMSNKT